MNLLNITQLIQSIDPRTLNIGLLLIGSIIQSFLFTKTLKGLFNLSVWVTILFLFGFLANLNADEPLNLVYFVYIAFLTGLLLIPFREALTRINDFSILINTIIFWLFYLIALPLPKHLTYIFFILLFLGVYGLLVTLPILYIAISPNPLPKIVTVLLYLWHLLSLAFIAFFQIAIIVATNSGQNLINFSLIPIGMLIAIIVTNVGLFKEIIGDWRSFALTIDEKYFHTISIKPLRSLTILACILAIIIINLIFDLIGLLFLLSGIVVIVNQFSHKLVNIDSD